MTGAELWTSEEAAAATGGQPHGRWRAGGVSIDSRTVARGDLFVALAGPRFDGHDFVADALAKGAAAAVVSRVPAGVAPEAPLLRVGEPLEALIALGRAARARSRARIVGVTGSVGKTGIKEALRTVLSAQGPTSASEGSLNNHWGLPLSLARLPRDAAFGIFEMGMNHAGEIAPLTRLARPHVAVVTTVAAVHRAHFSSVDEIADAKAEILEGVDAGGAAVLNRDNAYFARLAAAAARCGIARIVSFGRDPAAAVRLMTAEPDADGATVRADVDGTVVAYRLEVPGDHWVDNSLCVLAAVAAFGADIDAAAAALSRVRPAKGRGQRFVVRLAAGSFVVIDDSYNANPSSMLAAFDVLGRARPGPGGRRIAVLGDMLELGEETPAMHAALAGPIAAHGIDLVFAAGPAMRHLYEALPAERRGGRAETSIALVAEVAAAVRPDDVILVKGSAGSRMGPIVADLLALDVSGDRGARRRADGR
jgi:UDP-N-acetylmuramoyl-tripeptide--D-alanyl-D-alanine ligase